MNHGSVYAYQSLGCRCPDCRAAATAYQTDWRRKKRLGIARRRYIRQTEEKERCVDRLWRGILLLQCPPQPQP